MMKSALAAMAAERTCRSLGSGRRGVAEAGCLPSTSALGNFESDTIDLEAGDRIRWTRNHSKSGLVNGATATIETMGRKFLVLVTDEGRRLKMDFDDPRLRHIAHAYATTVHAAQGLAHDKVIAVLDSGHGYLANQQTFYVEISRARDEAIVLTDNREQLAETLEENTGEVLTALEAVGESLRAIEATRRHDGVG